MVVIALILHEQITFLWWYSSILEGTRIMVMQILVANLGF